MSGLGISDLPWPADEWRVDLHSRRFETLESAAKEDAKRSRRLRKVAAKRKGKRRKKLLALADLLDPVVTPEVHRTLASSRYLRQLRIRITGAVWQVVAQAGEVARCDVIKPSWACDRGALGKEKAARIRAEFRADVLRAAVTSKPGGAASCSGFLFGWLHGEFESEDELFQPHWHLVATGDWITVMDQLRQMRAYRPTGRVKRPVRVRRKLHDLAYALTYIIRSYWPGKWCGRVSGKPDKRRRRDHGRIPEPFHSDVLLWLHLQKNSDLGLMMGMRAGKSGLVVKRI